MRIVSETEVKRLISEFAYDEETSGVLGFFCEEGFPVYCANKKMISMLGYESAEDLMDGISGKGFNVVHPDDRSQVMKDIGNNIREGSSFQSIYRMRRKDGSWFWTIDKGKVMKAEDGRLLLLSLFSDMTEFAKFMKEREESEERKNKKLEKEKNSAVSANAMKSRFLSSISHDIRTPINGIQGMLRIADTYPNDMKKQNECREKMWIATNYLVSLVNNVLNMNRLENRSIDLTKQPFNLINLLMDITSMADLQTNAEGLHSVVDWKPGYINHRYLIGSAEGLSRILMNLNNNAVKYNKKNGSVYCRCKELECDGETALFEFIIRDTGIGMSEEFLEHAFDAYEQAESHTLNTIHGVGLGLAIVKQTVDLMGGTLHVESELGKGTQFTIVLPFEIDHEPKIQQVNYENVSLKGVRALLVEDNELNMEIAKFYLEQEDIEVTEAENGLEAVKLFEDSPEGYYDIILMDIMMPVMNGLEATKAIRGMDRADAVAIPIIAMSANAFDKDIQESVEAGLNAYLVKPMDGKKVTDTMKRFLANKITHA